MTQNDTPIEERIDTELHHLLDFMSQENDYSDNYKSMVTHLTKVMEIRQKEHDSVENRGMKKLELSQQKELSELTLESKRQELQQQADIAQENFEVKSRELQQQKQIHIDNHKIELSKLNQRNIITREAWLTVGTHIAGLIVLMNHERAHVIASKAFGLLKKIT